MVTQLESGRAEIQAKPIWLQSLHITLYSNMVPVVMEDLFMIHRRAETVDKKTLFKIEHEEVEVERQGG